MTRRPSPRSSSSRWRVRPACWCRPVGYLQKLRDICTQHGILLIFDEVICGFGRVGENFGAQRYGVTPDLITFAKGITNGIVPMGGVLIREEIYQQFMGADAPAHAVELLHGYTYSGHPLAAAAGHAALDLLNEGGLTQRSRELEPVFEDVVHGLKGETGVIDIRNSRPGRRHRSGADRRQARRARDAGLGGGPRRRPASALHGRHDRARPALHLHRG